MKVVQLSLALVGAILFASTSHAGSIAVSFAGDIGGGVANNVGAGTAGVVAQANWNNGSGASGGLSDLNDDSGAATTADVDWTSANTWGGSSWFTADEAVVNGWLDDGGSGNSVNVAEIPYNRYDVIVYFSSDVGNDGRGSAISVNGNVKESVGGYVNLNGFQTFFNGLVDGDSAADDPTYFVWEGVTGSSLEIKGVRQIPHPSGGRATRGAISGFQIVEVPVPEPTSIALGMGALAMCLAARRRS